MHKENSLSLQQKIEKAYELSSLEDLRPYKSDIEQVVHSLDKGELRVASPMENHQWQTHEWIKKAILLYFKISKMQTFRIPPFEFYDKIPLKEGYQEMNVRSVPHAICRKGAFLSKGIVLMPSYVNIGAYVGEGTMVDTWATVGSCAQIGKNVHLSGGVGIGGVLEPLQANPVIIEDNCFIGSRCIVVEGAIVEEEAVLGANVVITKSTKIIDVTHAHPLIHEGRVPARSVVIPGTYPKTYPAGEYGVPCALIIGERTSSTDRKTSLNNVLRKYNITV